MTPVRPAPPRRRRVALLVSAAVLLLGGLTVVPLVVESRIRSRLEGLSTASRTVTVDEVSFSFFRRLALLGISVRSDRVTVRVEAVRISWLPVPGPLRSWARRIRVTGAAVSLPGELGVLVRDEDWGIVRLGKDGVSLRHGFESIRLTREGLELARVDLTRVIAVTKRGRPLFGPGRASGALLARREEPDGLRLDAQLLVEAFRLAPRPLDEGEEAPVPAAPLDFEVSASALVSPPAGRLALSCWRFAASGLLASGSGVLIAAGEDAWADLSVSVPRVDLSTLLSASGLDLPPDVAPLSRSTDLGSASLVARMTGRLRDPDSIVVEERLEFVKPKSPVPAIERLKGPFVHQVEQQDGTLRRLVVRPGSPDFVAFSEVPPLFVRTLTIAEDAGFWGHRGLDLREIPVAAATNFKRGERVRGASTITQQLAKNLFLTRRKSLSRKAQEASLALLLDASLGKQRVLEIYLNIIEWGPGVYGLRPAACHYFGKEPADLTPKEMVLLVSLIPGPMKYQKSITGGVVTPRFGGLLSTLLAKLRSVDALTDDEYLAAQAEPILLTPGAVAAAGAASTLPR